MPTPLPSSAQRTWKTSAARLTQAEFLLSNDIDYVARARLPAILPPGSGDWFDALLQFSLGLKVDNATVRTGLYLRLGALVVQINAHTDTHTHHDTCGITVTMD